MIFPKVGLANGLGLAMLLNASIVVSLALKINPLRVMSPCDVKLAFSNQVKILILRRSSFKSLACLVKIQERIAIVSNGTFCEA
jgi:hypothetical protein